MFFTCKNLKCFMSKNILNVLCPNFELCCLGFCFSNLSSTLKPFGQGSGTLSESKFSENDLPTSHRDHPILSATNERSAA